METERRPAHVPEMEGRSLWVLDSYITIKLTGESTDGEMTLLDSVVLPHTGPPPHIHEREDETFYILEGEFEFLAGEEWLPASAGSVVYAPRGIPHTYNNVGEETGRMLTVITPSGLEKFFESVENPPKTRTRRRRLRPRRSRSYWPPHRSTAYTSLRLRGRSASLAPRQRGASRS